MRDAQWPHVHAGFCRTRTCFLAPSLVVAVARLARHVFDLEWLLAWWVVPATAFSGAALAWLAGWWSLRSTLRQPIMQGLRVAA